MIHLFLLNFICELHCTERNEIISHDKVHRTLFSYSVQYSFKFMPRKKNVNGRILALLQLNYSHRQIGNILKNDGINELCRM